MIKYSTLIGTRSAEICALKWDDINIFKKEIWVHSQILEIDNEYIYVPYTKDDKKHTGKGREIALTDDIIELLEELKEKQKSLGITSEYVFCNADGSCVHPNNQYQQTLRDICQKLGYTLYRNHAIRKYFNSYVLVPLGISVEDRAKAMGHSVKINLENYTFEQKDYVSSIREKNNKSGTGKYQENNIKKMLETQCFQAF